MTKKYLCFGLKKKRKKKKEWRGEFCTVLKKFVSLKKLFINFFFYIWLAAINLSWTF